MTILVVITSAMNWRIFTDGGEVAQPQAAGTTSVCRAYLGSIRNDTHPSMF